MSNRKYIHLRLQKVVSLSIIIYWLDINGIAVKLQEKTDYDWGNLNKGSKNLALTICKELYPGHEADLYEVFCRDYIATLKDSDIIDVSLDINEFVRYARDVIRIKQGAGVESIDDILPF